jgi:hypothetical protein
MNLAAGETCSGTEVISASINEATFDIHVVLSIDSVGVSTQSSSSFSYSWDTTKYSNGTHTIRIAADDTVGNERYEEVVVNVANAITTRSTSTSTTTTTTSSQAGGPIASPVSLAVGLVAVVTVVAGSVYCKHAGLRTKTGTTQMIANEP